MNDEHVEQYLAFLASQGRHSTLRVVRFILDQYAHFLRQRDASPILATLADLGAYRLFLTTPAASVSGEALAISTQATRLSTVKAFHQFLRRRGFVVHDVTKDLAVPKVSHRSVQKDWLDQQEAQALLSTAAEIVKKAKKNTKPWATAYRDLAVVVLGLATGRRRSGLLALGLSDLNQEEKEIRVAWEKGRPGRVLPVAAWAIDIVVAYRDHARPLLLEDRASDALFVGQNTERYAVTTYAEMLQRLHKETCTKHPDLLELPQKNLTTHSLRVTFARTLFANGCGIRSINELMLHQKLSTTAAYTPIPLEEMRRVLRTAHPRT
jgi:integrase/recombinase XerC